MSKILLTNRAFIIGKKENNGYRVTWYSPICYLLRYKSVVACEWLDTTSSCGDWSGYIVQKIGKTYYAIPFYQENNYPHDSFTLTTSNEIAFGHKVPELKEVAELISSF